MFCFFEGKDNAYYVPRIKKFTENYYPIRCGGREKVLAVHKLITYHSEYDKYKKGFFIDRDFNPPLAPQNPPIFETPCYSIENFYVSINVFKQILTEKFNLSEFRYDNTGKLDTSFAVCVQLFKDRQQEFHQAVLLFNAWYACLIKIRNKTGEKTQVNLKDKFSKQLLKEFSLNSISADYELEDLKTIYSNTLVVAEKELNHKLAEFANCEYHQVFRGKYELEFVLRLIDLLIEDSCNSQQYIKSKIKFDFGSKLTNEQAIILFSNHAETPESLNVYLEQVT